LSSSVLKWPDNEAIKIALQEWVRRAVACDTTDLPVPVDALVYTLEERKTLGQLGRFQQTLARQAISFYEREGARPL
jgi:hypothetical protein